MGKYHRVMMYLVILLPIMIVIRPRSVDRYGIFSTIAEAIFAVLFLLYAYAMVQLFRRMNQLKG